MKTITKKIIGLLALVEGGESAPWIYSFGNEHIITGEEGNYLFFEETYYNTDGTIMESRYCIYLQP